ncbi:hypothetical protein FRB96_006291 [Tulasnella sp. 330]|nr:hypothetical protein FRB96_006291 [Tulasnella sp. 330]KAG8885102.1 hypothetical protein FRB97_002267 [Tulasnella sp. 331]KAG8890611.1 hypothetical protein FRB98_007166 [Tulasnella sp. 332]
MSPIINEKGLPCIMVTPSTPAHETDFEIFYFTPEPKQPGFFSNIRQLFASTRQHRIALPDSPSPSPTSASTRHAYGQMETTPHQTWSAAKKLRVFLTVLGALFFALHLIIIPHATGGIYNIFHDASSNSDSTYGSALLWEGLAEVPAKGTEPVLHVAAPAGMIEPVKFATMLAPPSAVENAVPTVVVPTVPSSHPSPATSL